jgi:TRAP-type C4-dicarboxylate transport system substrate-binding protein
MKKCTIAGMLFVSLALLAGSIFAASDAQAAPIRVSVSQTSSDQSPWQKGAVAFANYLNEKSGGRYEARVFANASLSQGNYTIMMEQIQSGALQVAVESLTVLGAYNEKAGILNMPFTFADIDHVLRFLNLNDPTWAGFMKNFETANFVILAASPRPMRQLNNNIRTIKKVEDMANIKFRVPANPMYVSIFEALGAKPVPAPSSEIYTGIQLGTFNGEDNSVQIQYDFKTFEVAKNFSIINYIADLSFIFMNKDFYYKASADDRKLFHAAAQEFVKTDVAENKTYYDVAMAAGRKLGVDFYVVPEADKQGFRDKLAPFFTDFQKKFS